MARKFLLIDSRLRAFNRDNLIGIAPLLLGSYISQRIPELDTEIVDLGLEEEQFLGSQGFESLIAGADVVGVSCGTSFFYQNALKVVKMCRSLNPTVPIVVGGHHANILPRDFLKYPKFFDAVASGWGETAMEEIVTYFAQHNYTRPPQPLFFAGPPIPTEKNVITIDWSLLRKYFQSKTTIPAIYLKFARGCSQRCHFCSNSGAFRFPFRSISPENAFAQLRSALEFIVNEGVVEPRNYLLNRVNLGVSDELFGQNRDWQHKFLTKLIESRSSLPYENFNLYVDQRIDQFTQEDVELFDRARVNVAFGVESFDPTILTNMGKTGNPTRYLQDAQRVLLHPVHALKNTHYNIMLVFGFPSETQETLDRTGRVLQSLGREMIEPFSIQGMFFALFPSTEVHDNMHFYKKSFGSRFYFPSWWRSDSTKEGSVINDPSSQFSFNELFRWVTSRYPPIIERLYDRCIAMGAPEYFKTDLERFRAFIQKCLQMREQIKFLIPNNEIQPKM